MAGNDDIVARLRVDGLKDTKQGFDEVATGVEGLDAALDDTRTKAQKVADAVKAGGDEVVGVLRADQAAAEALGQALGPELAAKIGAGGIDEAITKFKKLGLTTEEIKADADALADSIRHLDSISVGDAGLSKLDGAATSSRAGIDDLGKSAGSSKSVLANMVGNSVQDVGQLGGVAGPAGVAIGQMGEYIVDAINDGDKLGETLGNFAKVAGPMALLAVAVQGVSTYLNIAAEEEQHASDVAKVHADNVKALTKIIQAGGDEVQAYAKHLEDLGRINLTIDGSHILPVALDISDALLQTGASLSDFSAAVVGSDADLQAFADRVRATDAPVTDQNAVIAAATQQHKDYAKGAEQAAKWTELAGGAMVSAKDSALGLTGALVGLGESATRELGEVATRAAVTAEAIGAAQHAVADLDAAQLANLKDAIAGIGKQTDDTSRRTKAFSDELDNLFGGKTKDLETSARGVLNSYDDLLKSIKKNGSELNASNEAGRENLDNLDKGVGAVKDYAQAQLANGASVDEVTQSTKDNIATLVDQAVKLGLNREQVQAYIDSLGLTPENVTTAVKIADENAAKQKIQDYKDLLSTIPLQQATQILTEIDEGSFQKAADDLQSWVDNHALTLGLALAGAGAGSGVGSSAGTNGITAGAGFGAGTSGGAGVAGAGVGLAINFVVNAHGTDPYSIQQAVLEGIRHGLYGTRFG